MNIKYIFLLTLICTLFSFGIWRSSASAASVPILSLAASGSSVTVTVSGADPAATAILYYSTATSSYASLGLGLTNSAGYLSVSVPNSSGVLNSSPVYVIVDGASSASQTWPGSVTSGTLSLSQTALSLSTNQSGSITVSGASGAITVTQNSNSSVAIASVFGTTVVITGTGNTGITNMTICDSANSCQTLTVSVISGQAFSLASTAINLTVGQSQSVAVSGFGPYVISQNTSPSVVSPVINGNNLVLYGASAGNAGVTVCQGSACSTINIAVNSINGTSPITTSPANTVSSQPTVVTSTTPVATPAPMLSSVTMSTNGSGSSFGGLGSTLSFTFNVNQQVTGFNVTVGGVRVPINGSGSGPYTTSYTVSNSTASLPVSVSFSNASGLSGQSSFSIGVPAIVSSAPSVPVSSPILSAFNTYLYAGMTALNVSSPDVLALQQRLKKDGFFSGAVTGYFGPQTKASLMAYQKKYGLDPLGVVGPATRALLNKGI